MEQSHVCIVHKALDEHWYLFYFFVIDQTVYYIIEVYIKERNFEGDERGNKWKSLTNNAISFTFGYCCKNPKLFEHIVRPVTVVWEGICAVRTLQGKEAPQLRTYLKQA